MLITTTDTLQGVEIAEYIGMVTGETPMTTPNIAFGGMKVALKKGDLSQRAEIINNAICSDLTKSAEKVGADAVIGVRWNYNAKSDSTYSYGTAVKLKK